jgi:hypothetical protein
MYGPDDDEFRKHYASLPSDQKKAELARTIEGLDQFNDLMRQGIYFAFMEASIGEKVPAEAIAGNLDEIAEIGTLLHGADDALDRRFDRAMEEARRGLAPWLASPQAG